MSQQTRKRKGEKKKPVGTHNNEGAREKEDRAHVTCAPARFLAPKHCPEAQEGGEIARHTSTCAGLSADGGDTAPDGSGIRKRKKTSCAVSPLALSLSQPGTRRRESLGSRRRYPEDWCTHASCLNSRSSVLKNREPARNRQGIFLHKLSL